MKRYVYVKKMHVLEAIHRVAMRTTASTEASLPKWALYLKEELENMPWKDSGPTKKAQ